MKEHQGGTVSHTLKLTIAGILSAAGIAAFSLPAVAQNAPKQVVKPPVAQGWIDVATFSGMGFGPGMMNATLGSLMGGGNQNAKAEFGYTETGTAGRWMDVTLYTSRNTSLAEALQAVPAATQLAPTLKLQTPEKPKPPPPVQGDEEPAEWNYEPPKGKLVMYWGCSETVRPGQPKIVDLSTATVGELSKFFESRRATQRGAHATFGRPVWPSKDDKRALPAGASIAGQHVFTGDGVPESFNFTIPAAQDVMPEIQVRQQKTANALQLSWNAIPHARAYFLGSMGALPDGEDGFMIWTSSELPESGFGLFDYQTNRAVDGWLKDKVLLAPTVTTCAVPNAAAGQGMLRAIAYGSELNLAHPPRPTDPKVAWEPDWNLKVRVKSMSTTMMGMEGEMPTMGAAPSAPDEAAAPEATPSEEPKKKKKFNPFEVIKDVVKDKVP
jgi:hypothetical protein